jgi:DNA-binding transcriptional ArsR family regulator
MSAGPMVDTQAHDGQGGEAEPLTVPANADSSLSEAELAARFFRVLGDPTRLRLLRLLLLAPSGGRSVGDLVVAVGAPQGRVSAHLGCLRWCGLVRARREGRQVYYSIADERTRELLALATGMQRDNAASIASCGMLG